MTLEEILAAASLLPLSDLVELVQDIQGLIDGKTTELDEMKAAALASETAINAELAVAKK